MRYAFTFEAEPFEISTHEQSVETCHCAQCRTARQGVSFEEETKLTELGLPGERFGSRGRWFRQGSSIFVFPEIGPLSWDEGVYELSGGSIPTAIPRVLTYSTKDVIDKRISVPAQHSLVRLSKNPSSSADAVSMLEAVKAGRLGGIFCVNWQKPAQRAIGLGKSWWTVIPSGEDAVLMLDPSNLESGQPLIAFRRELSPDCGLLQGEKKSLTSPARLDAALLKVWAIFRIWLQGKTARCGSQTSAGFQLNNIVPPGFCQQPTLGKPPATTQPTITAIIRRTSSAISTATFSFQTAQLNLPSTLITSPDTVILRPRESAVALAGAKPRADGRPPFLWEIRDRDQRPAVAGLQVARLILPPTFRTTSAGVNAIGIGSARITVTANYRSRKSATAALLVIVHPFRTDLFSLRRDFPNIRIERGDKDWELIDLADLRWALSLLNTDELHVLDGYTFHRQTSLRQVTNAPFECGHHLPGLVIEVSDLCFGHPNIRPGIFIPGEFVDNVALGTFNILHEIGHAMECSEPRTTGRGICGPGGNTNIVRQFSANDTPNRQFTQVARTDPAERFAEAFAVFRANRDHLRQDFPNLFRFFNGNIRGNSHLRRGPYTFALPG